MLHISLYINIYIYIYIYIYIICIYIYDLFEIFEKARNSCLEFKKRVSTYQR